MIIRGSMGQKLPYGRINKSDILYLCLNEHDMTFEEIEYETKNVDKK